MIHERNKLNFITNENCYTKDKVKRMRRQATDKERYFQKVHLKKACYPKYKEFLKLNKKI